MLSVFGSITQQNFEFPNWRNKNSFLAYSSLMLKQSIYCQNLKRFEKTVPRGTKFMLSHL